jgi:hypothetical protein
MYCSCGLQRRKEIEDKAEYRANRLIGKLPMSDKKKKPLREEYSKLSQMVHPTHKQVISTLTDLKKPDDGAPSIIDRDEILRIYESMARMYDIFFLFTTYFPEIREELKKNTRFIEQIKVHNLTLLSKILDVRIDGHF